MWHKLDTPPSGLTLDARYDYAQILIGQLVLELFAPFEETCPLVAEHIEDARVFELIGVLKAVQVKVKQGNASAIMHSHQGKRGARHGMVITQSSRDALGEMRLAHTQAAGEHQHVAIGQTGSDKLSQANRILNGRTLVEPVPLARKRHTTLPSVAGHPSWRHLRSTSLHPRPWHVPHGRCAVRHR